MLFPEFCVTVPVVTVPCAEMARFGTVAPTVLSDTVGPNEPVAAAVAVMLIDRATSIYANFFLPATTV